MNVKKYKLGDKKARDHHIDIINSDNSYSLTLTLNPYYNGLPVNEQYNKLRTDVMRIMKDCSHYYRKMFITPEFTVDYNVHFHIYFTTNADIFTFEQNFKKNKMTSKVIGRMYKLKKIDEVTSILIGYPFKDIERTTRFSECENCLFKPEHIMISCEGNIFEDKVVKEKGNKTIKSFIDFVNSQKNI